MRVGAASKDRFTFAVGEPYFTNGEFGSLHEHDRQRLRPAGLAGPYLPKDMVSKVPEDLKMWVKRPAGHYYLPLMFNVSAGITVTILRYPNPGAGRHVHEGPGVVLHNRRGLGLPRA
jgi:hypothetical protein